MASQEEGWTDVGRTGARPEPELYEPRPPSEEGQQNPFGGLGETDDPSTDIAAASEDAADKAADSAEKNGSGAGEIVEEGTKEVDSSEEGSGFGAAGKDGNIKALAGGQERSFPEEYGAADDEFVTRTDYPPSKPVEDGRKEAAGGLKKGVESSEEGPGFGAAGKDGDIKAPAAAKDESLSEEYGAADDEFVTKTNYPPSEPEHNAFVDAAKSFVAGVTSVAGGEDTGPGTLVTLKNKIAEGSA